MGTNDRTHRGTRRPASLPPQAASQSPQSSEPPPLPESFRHFLRDLELNYDFISGAGRPYEERRFLAERLVQAAVESQNESEAIPYFLRAVRLDPAVLDARLFLALTAGGPTEEFIEELQKLVALGEADLGAEFFAEHRGHFWALIETRPYIRVRARLAYELAHQGRTRDAIHHCEQILQLNSDDNQGLRYVLLGLYLEVDDLESARRMLGKYGKDASPVFLWGMVLERYLSGDLPAALKALQFSRTYNSHVEHFITGRKRLPRGQREYFSPGDVSEAVECVSAIGDAWKKHPQAVQWLKTQGQRGRPVSKSGKKKTE